MHKIFQIVKKSNYHGIDLVIDKTNFDTLDEAYLQELSKSTGVPILSITAPDKGIDPAMMDRIMQMADVFNTQVINFFPPHITDKGVEWYLEKLSELKKRSTRSICMQNIEQKFMMFIIPEYKNNNLQDLKQITGDTALSVAHVDKSSGIDLMRMQQALWNSIKNVFISDRNGNKDWLLPGTSGWGISYLPLESFLMKLKASDYNGFFTLKVKPQELDAWDDEKVLFHLEQFHKYLEKHFHKFEPN